VLADWRPTDRSAAPHGRRRGHPGQDQHARVRLGWEVCNPHYGSGRNPWNPERFPAGSSGGSGAAVAARTCFGALGTDTGGSIRPPSAVNGIVGIRPTIGRVSNAGVVPLAWSMDTVGHARILVQP